MLSRSISPSVFWAFPYQHNGTYTRNVYPATPTKKPAQILRFAESENEPLSRKILGKAAQKALGKGTGPSNLLKSILASFCHASKNGRKKARKSLKLLGFSQRHLFWCSLMVDLKRLELSTSRMRTERSPEWFRYMHPKFLENSKNIGILRKPSDMSFLYKGTFSAAPQQGKVSFVLRS